KERTECKTFFKCHKIRAIRQNNTADRSPFNCEAFDEESERETHKEEKRLELYD
ncbi:hypothetical protein RUM43_008729, partial [Polyplax serrata]